MKTWLIAGWCLFWLIFCLWLIWLDKRRERASLRIYAHELNALRTTVKFHIPTEGDSHD